MATCAAVLLGAVSLSRMPVALLPDVAFPRLVVWTTAAEVGPVEVERFVTEPIEETLSSVPGVRRVESVSRVGQSVVTLEFPWGTDMEFAQLHVRERLDAVAGQLPQAARRPAILRVDPGARPILVATAALAEPVGGPSAPGREAAGPADLHAVAETVVRRRLEQLDGVGRVEVVGGAPREIVVEVDPAALESRNLSIEDVASALDRANASAPGGTIRRGEYRYALRALGELASADEIAGVVVARAQGGGTVLLSDVAVVADTVAEREASAWYGGRPAVGLLVYKEADANTVAAVDEARATLAALEAQYGGVELPVVTEQGSFVTAALRGVLAALLVGGLLAFLVLFPFLRDPRWPAAIAVAIPVSVVAAFALLHLAGVSLNVMSLGGLALGVGMLVDNSIVVLENVFRHRERGLAPAEAAAVGAREVQGAITASTLTTIAVFGPLVYVEGLAGELFRDLALAVAFSLLASLGVALTVLPALAARFGSGRTPGRFGGWRATAVRPLAERVRRVSAPGLAAFDRGFARLAAAYERTLTSALDRPGRVVAGTAAALGLALVVALLLPRNLLPEVDPRAFTVRLDLPPGTPFERTEAAALELDSWLRGRPDVAAVLTRVGRASAVEVAEAGTRGRSAAVVDVRLASRGSGAEEVAAELRRAFAALPPGGLAVETGRSSDLGAVLGGEGADLAVGIQGADLDTLRAVAARVAVRLSELDRLADVRSNVEAGQPEFRISLDREAIARYGLDPARVARELVDRTRGRTATELSDVDRKVPVVVRPEDAVRRDLDRLLEGRVDGVPLSLLVEARRAEAPAAIPREDQRRTVAVTADVVRGGLSGAAGAVEAAL
ncbi:MAG TPA: efflux RND transporter permease subunit, partial [Gemmatimonadota bacterium]|nr:efflux RND transporter permease subunit [Gemmatimonadota bacterium]